MNLIISTTSLYSCRYDLHEWIFTLHNVLESFQKRQLRTKAREEQRQRSRSTSGGTTPTGRTPPHTPSRRAPPPPAGGSNKSTGSQRRRPVRPAPTAPGVRRQESGEQPAHVSEGATAISLNTSTSPIGRQGESPPPAYASEPSTPALSQEPAATLLSLGSEHHPIMDLNITQTEVEGTPPMHVRSASDSLVLMHETSHSMPDLAEDGDSTSPEGSQTEQPRKRSTSMSRDPPSISTHLHGHTRHLSLTISEGEGKRFRKRRSSKRDGSLKLRSRSPPNLPPPPPPPDGSGADSSCQDTSPQHHLTVGSAPSDDPTGGDSEFMNTISNIDQQLEEMANHDSPPVVSVPQQSPTSSDHIGFEPTGSSPVPEYPEEEEQTEFILPAPQLDEMGELVREYTTSDIDELERVSPEGAQITHEIPPPFEFDTEDSDDIEVARKDNSHDEFVENQIMEKISFGESSQSTDGLAVENEKLQNTDRKPAKAPKPSKQHRVMFKDEVEDIPPRYDPTYDPDFEASLERYEPRVDEEIPSTVAELKKMLFGEQATEVTRYSTEGSLSPRYTHPVNMSFETDYEFHRDSSLSPNNNNNNSREQRSDIGPQPRAVNLKEEEKEEKKEEDSNLYETPWDQKPVSKYSVVGMRKRTGSGGQKDRISPSRERIQFAEVSTHEEPVPGNTELRNVHSLERPAKHHRHSPKASPEHSLLESISNTLQGRSNYGSDSLLNSVSPEEQPKSSQQLFYSPQQNRKVPRSARGELEKIKAEHRREQKPARPMGITSMNGQPRLAASWDELQHHPSTHVTYDANTQTHILRSLV